MFGRTLAVLAIATVAMVSGAGAALAVDYGQTGDGGGGGGLAWTGATAILPLSVIGGALIVLGVLLVMVMRRRANDRQ